MALLVGDPGSISGQKLLNEVPSISVFVVTASGRARVQTTRAGVFLDNLFWDDENLRGAGRCLRSRGLANVSLVARDIYNEIKVEVMDTHAVAVDRLPVLDLDPAGLVGSEVVCDDIVAGHVAAGLRRD